MSMFNDIVWDAKGNDELCVHNSKTIIEYPERFPRGHRSFLGPGSEKKWYGTYDGKPDGSWNRTARKMVQNCEGSGHPIFRCARPLERGRLREGNSGETDDSESEPWYEKPAPQNNEACGKPLAGGSAEFVSSEFQKSRSNKGAASEHFLAISPHHVPYANDVYDIIRKVYARPADDSMTYLYVKMALW